MQSAQCSCQILIKLEFSRQIFEKSAYIKFHDIQSSGSQVVTWEQTEGRTEKQTDMAKLIVVFRNFANAPKRNMATLLI